MASSDSTREPYVYRCSKHNYVLETTAPKIGATLKIFCPLCKDEWFAQHLVELDNENPNAGKLKAREASNV
jgi:hypothetical protein